MLRLADGSATQLTFGTGSALLPAWSPDGATIVFDTQAALYDGLAAGRRRRAPSRCQCRRAAAPAWSPDGGRLAFVAASGQVWIANADGTNAHQVTYTLVGAESTPERARPGRPTAARSRGRRAWISA